MTSAFGLWIIDLRTTDSARRRRRRLRRASSFCWTDCPATESSPPAQETGLRRRWMGPFLYHYWPSSEPSSSEPEPALWRSHRRSCDHLRYCCRDPSSRTMKLLCRPMSSMKWLVPSLSGRRLMQSPVQRFSRRQSLPTVAGCYC